MLEVKNIHAAYGKVNVLRGIDLHLEEGEIVAVLGSNGAGKTTLLSALSRRGPVTAPRGAFS